MWCPKLEGFLQIRPAKFRAQYYVFTWKSELIPTWAACNEQMKLFCERVATPQNAQFVISASLFMVNSSQVSLATTIGTVTCFFFTERLLFFEPFGHEDSDEHP